MAKKPGFSFAGELPMHKTMRHCFGLVKVTSLCSCLTSLLLIQLILLLICCLVPSLYEPLAEFFHPGDQSNVFIGLLVLCSVWIVLFFTSVVALVAKKPRLLFPLLIFETTFALLSAAGAAVLMWNLVMSSEADERPIEKENVLLVRLCAFLLFGAYHSYYTFIVHSLYADLKLKIETDRFIARQMMIDEVCKEMYFEEQENCRRSEPSRVNFTTYDVTSPISPYYYPDDVFCSDNSSDLAAFYLDGPLRHSI
ncbi:unnamed protein product [Caenorhabditis sp. 36 PRJEB53466]|nr:unnamed protein product [Caenorhabditis sp. 36 PRJEB53466]